MSDTVSTEKRSHIMAQVKSCNTTPEIKVRKLLHKMGFRFRLHRKDLPGTPDIVLPRHRKIIFVHGCFWHGHKNCKRATIPKTNSEYWSSKIKRNIQRHEQCEKELLDMGWKILVIWECQMKSEEKTTNALKYFLSN